VIRNTNDYVNMFLSEMKEWLWQNLTRKDVSVKEVRQRCSYIKNLKSGDYHWCFPNENDGCVRKIHEVIRRVEQEILTALDDLEYEDKDLGEAMAKMFDEVIDSCSNTLAVGKRFLAYLLFTKGKAPDDLINNLGSSIESGSLVTELESGSVRFLAQTLRLQALSKSEDLTLKALALELGRDHKEVKTLADAWRGSEEQERHRSVMQVLTQIFEAHALLQALETTLSWVKGVNRNSIAMFGKFYQDDKYSC
jgi:stress-induced morphogen